MESGDATSLRQHDLETLRAAAGSGARLKYLLFWGHTPARSGELGKECLSQWYPARFEVDGLPFATAEHYMMYRKALLFADAAAAEQILGAPTPGAAKSLGRSIRDFDEAIWVQQRSSIVVDGNYAKFSQSPLLREFLLNSKPRVLVEASPVDRVWGSGLAADDPHAEHPLAWRGLNLLGFALMDVRARLG
jgi:ribA/ribD-fused uncharacterized protein